MDRIASPRQLQDELRALITYAASEQPSRIALARRLEELATRVAAKFAFDIGDRVRVTANVGGFRRGTVVRVMGRFSDLGGEKYIVRGARGDQEQLAVELLEPA